MAEGGGQSAVATDELCGRESVTFCLHDVMVVDRAELTNRPVNRTDEICICEWSCADPEWPGEEVIEGLVAADIGVGGFRHVDAVLGHEPTD